jgi:hypothetical protein
MEIQETAEPRINGADAVVRCTIARSVETRSIGKQTPPQESAEFHLRKTNGVWLIVDKVTLR